MKYEYIYRKTACYAQIELYLCGWELTEVRLQKKAYTHSLNEMKYVM